MEPTDKQIETARINVIEDESRRYQALSYAIDIAKGSKVNIQSPEELIGIADIIERYLKEGKPT